MSVKDEIIESYKNGGGLTKLIYINVGVFLLFILLVIFCKLMLFDPEWLNYFKVPADVTRLITQPWTIFTFMFTHVSFLHLLFNLFVLFWSGKLFLHYFNQKQLVGLYVIGGLFGVVFFVVLCNIFPYFNQHIENFYLLGSSSCALAIMTGVAAYAPNTEIRFTLLGKIKLKYIALVIGGLSLLTVAEQDTGNDFDNLGGIIAGYIFAMNFKKGKDITRGINHFFDFCVDFFTRKTKFKIAHNKKPKTDAEWNIRKKQEIDELDRILDKIKKSGYNSLTEEEKKRLFEKK
jgi:membrane associated rhomboid family serine protease